MGGGTDRDNLLVHSSREYLKQWVSMNLRCRCPSDFFLRQLEYDPFSHYSLTPSTSSQTSHTPKNSDRSTPDFSSVGRFVTPSGRQDITKVTMQRGSVRPSGSMNPYTGSYLRYPKTLLGISYGVGKHGNIVTSGKERLRFTDQHQNRRKRH